MQSALSITSRHNGLLRIVQRDVTNRRLAVADCISGTSPDLLCKAFGPLEAETSCAVAELLDFRVCQVGESKKEIRRGLFVFDRDVTIAFEPAVRPAEHNCRGIVAIVGVAVAHTGSEVDDRPVQKRAVAVSR